MSDPKAPSLKAHVALLVEMESLARAGSTEPVASLAGALMRYAAGVGKVTIARAYADWGSRADDARALQGARVVPVLVGAGPSGEDRAHVRLTVDALEALYAGGEPDAFVVASADARLLPLVHALRSDGCDVLFVRPAASSVADVEAEADVTVTIEDVLGGAVGPASTPRPSGADDDDAGDDGDGDDESGEGSGGRDVPAARPAPAAAYAPPPRAAPAPRPAPPARGGYGASRGYDGAGRGDRERGPRDRYPARGGYAPAPAPAELDLSSYDWAPFVRLIDDLEHRLPFVGVRYLVNKVMGMRNCGIDDPQVKRDLINRAVDEGILEMYEVGNVEGRGDPVTACRLDRKSPAVAAILGEQTATPVVPENRDGEEPPAGDPATGIVEGDLPLDANDDEPDAADGPAESSHAADDEDADDDASA